MRSPSSRATTLSTAGRRATRRPSRPNSAPAKLNPKETGAYLGLGRVYAAQNRVPETLAAYHKAVELKPKMGEARFNFRLVLLVTGKREEALAEYDALRKLDEKLAARFKEFLDRL